VRHSKALALLALVLAFPTASQAFSVAPRASSVASELVGHPVRIECAPSYAAWDADPRVAANGGVATSGLAFIPEGYAILSPAACDWRHEPGFAALTLTHESIHLTGVYNEATTECLAAKNVWRTIRLFGYSGERAKMAYRAAMVAHRSLLKDPTYANGVC
jgi:hypothetical protein